MGWVVYSCQNCRGYRRLKTYLLTADLYEKLISRGMWLVCRRCEMPLNPNTSKDLATGRNTPQYIISKPSKYRQWQCEACRYKFGKHRPKNIFKCPQCGTEGAQRTTIQGKIKQEPIVKDVGRKFYCQKCYDATVYDLMGLNKDAYQNWFVCR